MHKWSLPETAWVVCLASVLLQDAGVCVCVSTVVCVTVMLAALPASAHKLGSEHCLVCATGLQDVHVFRLARPSVPSQPLVDSTTANLGGEGVSAQTDQYANGLKTCTCQSHR